MNLSPNEAEQALETIQKVSEKTRHSIASGGTYISLIVTGIIWLSGFSCAQFLSGAIVAYVWIGMSVVGSIVATALNIRQSRHVHSPTAGATAKRIGLTWLLLAVYCAAAIAVASPMDGKKLTVFIVLFVLIGYLVTGLLLSFSSIWPGLAIIALMLTGYFLLPGYFYLWMAILGGGGMIFLGLFIHYRW